MTYNITLNKKFNSFEVTFDSKPAAAIRDALKSLKFRYNPNKNLWYGFCDREQLETACKGEKTANKASKKAPEKINRYGVKVGDIFYTSWGYEQTNVNFFQVIALKGEASVILKEVCLEVIEENITGMSSNNTYKIDRTKIHPSTSYSVFINNQELGDLKRVQKSKYDDSLYIKLSSFCDAYLVTTDTKQVFKSWYY